MIFPYSSGETIADGVVGRAIFQSNQWKKMQNEKSYTPPSIFRDKQSLVEISVFLLNFTSDETLTKIGDDMAQQRSPNRKFYGWAELSVADASEDERKVRATPRPENKWHADIVLPSSAKTDKKERERHANQLASMAVPRPCDR